MKIIIFDPSSVNFVGGMYVYAVPSFNTDFWNSEPNVENYNCYNYAVNVVTDFAAFPGATSAYDYWSAFEYYSVIDPEEFGCRIDR